MDIEITTEKILDGGVKKMRRTRRTLPPEGEESVVLSVEEIVISPIVSYERPGGAAAGSVVTIALRLQDFDGEALTESADVTLRIDGQDHEFAFVGGALDLEISADMPGVVSVELSGGRYLMNPFGVEFT